MSIYRGMDKEYVILTYMEYILTKNEKMTFVATRMDLEMTILSEIQSEVRERKNIT